MFSSPVMKQLMSNILPGMAIFLLIACGNHGSDVQNTASEDSSATDEYQQLCEQIKADPNNARLYYERAVYNLGIKDFDGAMGDINRAMKIDWDKPEYYLFKADLFFTKGKAGKAKSVLENCLMIDENNVEVCLKLAEIYLLVKQYDKSIEYINRALKTDKHNANAYFMKGMNYKYAGDTTLALSSFQTATEQDPDHYDAFVQLGLIHAARHDSLALAYYNNAIEIDSEKVDALYDRAIYLQDHGKREDAIMDYQRLLKSHPAFINAYYNLGYNYMFLENYRQATDYFTQAIALQPDYIDAIYNRGFCYEHLRDIKKSKADYRKCLDLDPAYTLAAKGLSRIFD